MVRSTVPVQPLNHLRGNVADHRARATKRGCDDRGPAADARRRPATRSKRSHGSIVRGGGGELAAETERERRLPDELVARLRDSGLLRAGAPREVGGLSWRPASRCGAPRRWPAGTRRPAGACRSRSRAACSPPTCPAESRDGAVRRRARGRRRRLGAARHRRGRWTAASWSRGRWAFCSGIAHADLLFAGCIVAADATPRTRGPCRTWSRCPRRTSRSSTPGTRWACAAPAATTRSPTRSSSPARRVFSLFDGPVVDRPLYRFPVFGFFALSIARGRAGQRARGDRRARRAGRGQGRPGLDPHAGRAPGHAGGGRPRRGVAARRAGAVLRGDRGRVAGGAGRRAGVRRDAHRPAPGGDPRGPDVGRGRRGRCTTWPAAPRSTTTRRCSGASATRTPPPRTSRSTRRPASCPAAILLGQPADTAML